jgi:DNA polymerase bacteriophage-type
MRKKLIIADASQIEPRCQAWITGDEEKMALMRTGMSVYEIHARKTMGWTGGVLKKEAPATQFIAKQRVLGLGYACGHVKFCNECARLRKAAIDDGVPGAELIPVISMMQAKLIVKDFRRKEKKIVNTWNRLDAAFQASKGGNYEIELPSGRLLRYLNVHLRKFEAKDGKASLEWAAWTTRTGKPQKFYGGKLFENVIQAVARDVFANMMVLLEDYYGPSAPILFHSHDEVILLADEDIAPAEVEQVMCECPSWLPGCPIGAEAIESEYYLK